LPTIVPLHEAHAGALAQVRRLEGGGEGVAAERPAIVPAWGRREGGKEARTRAGCARRPLATGIAPRRPMSCLQRRQPL